MNRESEQTNGHPHPDSSGDGEVQTAPMPKIERAETADDVYDDVPFSGIVWRKESGGSLARIAIIPHSEPVKFSGFIQENDGAHGTLLIRLHSAGHVEVEAGNPEGHTTLSGPKDREIKDRYMRQGIRRGREQGKREAHRELAQDLQDARLHIEKLESRMQMAEERRTDAAQRAERLSADLDRVMHEHRDRIRSLDEQHQHHVQRLREDYERRIDELKEKAEEAKEESMRVRETLMEMRHGKPDKGFLDSLGEHLGPELPNIIKIAAGQFAQRAAENGAAAAPRPAGSSGPRHGADNDRRVIQRDARNRIQRIPTRTQTVAKGSNPSAPDATTPRRRDASSGSTPKRMADAVPAIFGNESGPAPRPEARNAPPAGSGEGPPDGSSPDAKNAAEGDGLPRSGSTLDIREVEPATNPTAGPSDGQGPGVGLAGEIEQPSNQGPRRTAGDQIPDVDKPKFKDQLLADLLENAVWVAKGHNSLDWLESRVTDTIKKVQNLTATSAGAQTWDITRSDWANLAVDLMRNTPDAPAKDVGAVVAICVRYALGSSWKVMLKMAGPDVGANAILDTSHRTATDADRQRAVEIIKTVR